MTLPKVLTGAERESLNGRREEWAYALAGKLRQWCDDNNYGPRNQLATELEIDQTKWHHLIVGPSVSEDVTIYARLYLRTGLVEADPRRILPRVGYSPKGKSYYENKRAWEDQEYESWRRNYKLPQPLVGSPEKISVPVVPIPKQLEPQGQGWGVALERTVEALPTLLPLLQGLVPALQDLARKLGEQGKEAGGVLTVKAATAFLHDILHEVAEGTPGDRDAFYKKHGEQLLQILPLLSALTKDRDKRELEIEMMREMEGIAR